MQGRRNSKPGSRSSKPRTQALRSRPSRPDRSARMPRAPPPRERRGRGRTVAAVVLVVVALLLAPVAVITAWARLQLVDTDQFVATFAPLAEDPAVQVYIGDQVTAAIEEQVDIPALTSDLFDGIKAARPLAARGAGARAARGPATQGLQSLVSGDRRPPRRVAGVRRHLGAALRASHQAFVAAVQGIPDAALAIGGDGTVSVQLGPIIEAVKDRLVDQGVGFAANIPVIERSIVIAQKPTPSCSCRPSTPRGRRRHLAAVDRARTARGGCVRRQAPRRGARVDRGRPRPDDAHPRRGARHRSHVLHRHGEPVDHAVRHRIVLFDGLVELMLSTILAILVLSAPRGADRVVLRTVAPGARGAEFAGSGFAAVRGSAAPGAASRPVVRHRARPVAEVWRTRSSR